MFIILLIASEKQITLDMNLQFAICNFPRLYGKIPLYISMLQYGLG